MPYEPDHNAVIRAMQDHGLTVTWEYPGCAVIHYALGNQAWTGLHSYAYASLTVNNGGRWEPDEGNDASVQIAEDETNPDVIANAWAEWVHATVTDWQVRA